MRGMGAQRDTPDWVVAEMAGRQYGVVASGQLLGAGLSRGGIRRRAQSGRLHRIHRGVYAVGYPWTSLEGRWMAAILVAGRRGAWIHSGARGIDAGVKNTPLDHWGAALSHRSAAVLWGLLPTTQTPVCISVAGVEGKRRHAGVHIHRSRTLESGIVTSHRGLPVTDPVRTIADLRRAASTRGCPASVAPHELRRAIRQAEVLGLPTGAKALTERSRSDLELAFLELCRRHLLPEPELNVWVGKHQVDFLWRDERLVVETDGYRYHRGRTAFENDHARDLDLRVLGYEAMRFSDRQITEEPEKLVSALKRNLAVGSSLRRGVPSRGRG